jgi:mannose-6-phosphate isomerase-like protein (cupin superfamily)
MRHRSRSEWDRIRARIRTAEGFVSHAKKKTRRAYFSSQTLRGRTRREVIFGRVREGALLFGIMLSACAGEPPPSPRTPALSNASSTPSIRIVRVAAGEQFAETLSGCGTHAVFAMPMNESDARHSPIVLEGPGPVSVAGPATLVVMTIPRAAPCPATRLDVPPSTERLVWAKGAMRAYPEATTRVVYLGRLYGNASVPEHLHAESWELLCGIKASGAYTLDGVAHRLADGECAEIPPGTKHSWTPDPGTNLEAVQIYSPPGPEVRFRKLSAESGAPSK